MVTGVDVHLLIAEMTPGRIRGVRGRAIVDALRRYGVRCDDRFRAIRGRPLPEFAIVRILHTNKRGHVVVKHGRRWLDPNLEGPFEGDPPRGAVTPWAGGSRIVSALELYVDCRTPMLQNQ